MFNRFKKKQVEGVRVETVPAVIHPVTSKASNLEQEQSKSKSSAITCSMCNSLANRLICMVEDFEKNIEKIENHPGLDKKTKVDIQNYINKNIVTALWCLEPAFGLMKDYERLRTFKTIYTKSMNKGVPGILVEEKHV